MLNFITMLVRGGFSHGSFKHGYYQPAYMPHYKSLTVTAQPMSPDEVVITVVFIVIVTLICLALIISGVVKDPDIRNDKWN